MTLALAGFAAFAARFLAVGAGLGDVGGALGARFAPRLGPLLALRPFLALRAGPFALLRSRLDLLALALLGLGAGLGALLLALLSLLAALLRPLP